MGRKRRTGKKKKSGGALTSLRGGFRSTVRAATGSGQPRANASRGRRILGNVVTVVLLAVAAALLFRRFGPRH
jgi:hypothetical protein